MAKQAEKKIDVRELRKKLGLNQQQFWNAVKATQSGGSRFETHREMPPPMRELVRLVYIEGIDIAKAKGEDFIVAQHLRATNKVQFMQLLKDAKAAKKVKA